MKTPNARLVIGHGKPYPTYKESGVPWMGQIPQDWDVLPALAVYREKHVPNTGMIEATVLSISYGRIIVKPLEKLHGLVPQSFETYQIVDPGNIIVRTTDLQNDRVSPRIGLSQYRGIITSAYMCLETTSRASSQFGYQFLNAIDLLKVIYGYGSGLRQNLGFDDIKRMPVLVPPISEQLAITRFLSHVDGSIHRYVAAKQKLIKLLERQKLSIIDDAITHGLDSSASRRPSGRDWLGNMPRHWSTTRLKFIASDIVDCLHATPSYSDDGSYPAIRTADVTPGALLLSNARRVDEEQYRAWTQRMTPIEGDILYTREGERFGIAALVPADVQLCISQRMMAFRIKPKYNSEYIMWQLNCSHVYAQAACDLIGSAAPHVNVERIKNFWLLTPPREEQDRIVSALKGATAEIDSAIQHTRDEIRLIREYRTRLIADVVIGKIDIREIAADLPDEDDAPSTLLAVDEDLASTDGAEIPSEDEVEATA